MPLRSTCASLNRLVYNKLVVGCRGMGNKLILFIITASHDQAHPYPCVLRRKRALQNLVVGPIAVLQSALFECQLSVASEFWLGNLVQMRLCLPALPQAMDRHAFKPYPRVRRHRDQGISPSTKAKTADSAVLPSTRIRRPSDSVISTRCAETGPVNAGAETSYRNAAVLALYPQSRPAENWARLLSLRCPRRHQAKTEDHAATCGSDWCSSNSVGPPARPKPQAHVPERRSNASRHLTRTVSSDPSFQP